MAGPSQFQVAGGRAPNTTDLRCSGSREAVTWGFLLGCGMVPGVFARERDSW